MEETSKACGIWRNTESYKGEYLRIRRPSEEGHLMALCRAMRAGGNNL